MKDSKSSKGKAIVGTIVTLTAATIMMMAPMSQAQAVGLKKLGTRADEAAYAVCEMKRAMSHTGAPCKTITVTDYRAEGGSKGSVNLAKGDAKLRAICPPGNKFVPGSASWGAMGRWKDWDWYYADINFSCVPGNGDRAARGV